MYRHGTHTEATAEPAQPGLPEGLTGDAHRERVPLLPGARGLGAGPLQARSAPAALWDLRFMTQDFHGMGSKNVLKNLTAF